MVVRLETFLTNVKNFSSYLKWSGEGVILSKG